MKKIISMFVVLALGAVMVACGNDDDGKTKPDPTPDPTPEPGLELMMPKTIELYGVAFTYTMTGDKISKIVASDAKKGTMIAYDLKFEGQTCVVNYEDLTDGPCRYNFTLNSDGMAEGVTSYYVNADGTADQRDKMAFAYTGKMLTKVTDLGDPKDEKDSDMVVFSATYDKDAITDYSSSLLGDHGKIKITSSDKINNCVIDPIYLFPIYGMDPMVTLDAASVAVFSGLLPRTKYLPASIEVGGDPYPVECTIVNEKLTKFDVASGAIQIVAFTY